MNTIIIQIVAYSAIIIGSVLVPFVVYLCRLWKLRRQFSKTLKELNKRTKERDELYRRLIIELQASDINLDGEE